MIKKYKNNSPETLALDFYDCRYFEESISFFFFDEALVQ